MARKKRKRIILGQSADDAVVSSYEEGMSVERETGDAEYELRRSLEMCIRQAELVLDRMKAEAERQVNKC